MSRYDWSKIPADYEWAATDMSGGAYAFRIQPHIATTAWVVPFPNRGFHQIGFFNATDWRESREQRPKEKTMELDLNKPMRFKANKRQCWPSGMPVDGNYICVTYWDNSNNSHCDFCDPSLVENIPEPVKLTRYIHLTDRGDFHFCNGCKNGDHSKDAKLTVWRDEDGRTRVEVAE